MDVKTLDTKIKSLLKLKDSNAKMMCENLGITEQGYIYSIKNNSLKVETLLKICNYLEVSLEELLLFGERNHTMMNLNSLIDDVFIYSKQTVEKELLKNKLFIKFCEKSYHGEGDNNKVILGLKELVKTAVKLKDASSK